MEAEIVVEGAVAVVAPPDVQIHPCDPPEVAAATASAGASRD
jgi:hypothetical protein